MPPSMGATTVSLRELADLAIGTPEVGAVNFTALHTLIVAMLKNLNLQETRTDFQSLSPELSPRPSLSTPHPPATKEKRRSVSRVPSQALESQVQDLTRQLKTISNQVRGIVTHVQHLTSEDSGLHVDAREWLEDKDMAMLMEDKDMAMLVQDRGQPASKGVIKDTKRVSISKAMGLLEDVMEDVKILKEAHQIQELLQRIDDLENLIKDREGFLEHVGRRLTLIPDGEEVTMVTWQELEQAITDGWRASQAGSETSTGLPKHKGQTSLTSNDTTPSGASTKHPSTDEALDSAGGFGTDQTLSGSAGIVYPSEGVTSREQSRGPSSTVSISREQYPRARDEAGMPRPHQPPASQFRGESDRHPSRGHFTSAHPRREEQDAHTGLVQQDLTSARDHHYVHPDQHSAVPISQGQVYQRPDHHGLGPFGMDHPGFLHPSTYSHGVVPHSVRQLGVLPPETNDQGLVPVGMDQHGFVTLGTDQHGLVSPGMDQQGLGLPGVDQHGLVPSYTDQHGLVSPGLMQRGLVQPGMDQRGLVQPRVDQRGLVQPGTDQHGLVQPGTDQHGLVQPGTDQHGLVQPGMDQHGLVQLGTDQHGLVQPGTDQHGLVQPGTDQHGLVQPGTDQRGLVQPGMDQRGLVQPGMDQRGLHGFVQPGMDQSSLVQPGMDQRGLVQPGMDQRGLVQPGTDQRGLVQPGIDQHGLVQPGMDQRSLVQPGIDQHGLVQPGMDQHGLVQPGMDQPSLRGLVQPGVDQSGLVQPRVDQRGLVQPGIDQSGMVQPGADEHGLVQPGMDQRGLVQPRMDQRGLVQPGVDQRRLVQPRMDQHGLVQPRMDQHGLVQPGVDQRGLAQPRMDQRGLVPPGLDQRGLVQPGLDQRGLVQPGMDQRGLVQPGVDQRGLVQPGLDQRGLVQPRMDQRGLVQPGLDQRGLVQPRMDQRGLVQPGVDQRGLVQPRMDQRGLVQPGLDQRGLVQPRMDQRGLVQPGVDQRGLVQPRMDQLGLVQPGVDQHQRGLVQPGFYPRGLVQPGAYPRGLLQPGMDQHSLRQLGADQRDLIALDTQFHVPPTFQAGPRSFILPRPHQHGVVPPGREQHGQVSPLLASQGLVPPEIYQQGLMHLGTDQRGPRPLRTVLGSARPDPQHLVSPGPDQHGQVYAGAGQHGHAYSNYHGPVYPGYGGPGQLGVDQHDQEGLDLNRIRASTQTGTPSQAASGQDVTFLRSPESLSHLQQVSPERSEVQSERHDSLDKVAPSFPMAVETFRLMGELIGLYVELKDNMRTLNEEKAGQTDLEKIQYLLTLMVKKTLPPDLQEQLKMLKTLAKEVRQEKAKLERLQRILEGEEDREEGKELKAGQLSLQLRVLRVTVADIEKELTELRESQEQGKAAMENSVSEASLYLQDQLDKLRKIMESMLTSSSTLLSMSMVPHKALVTSAPGQIDPEATCPACSLDLSHQVSMLVQRYEQLQDMVNNLAASRPSKKAKLQSQDEELLGHVQSAILQVQGDCEKLTITTSNLIEDHRQKQEDINVLYRGLEKLEKEKANRDHLEMEIGVKADKSALASKVSRVQFDATTEQLNHMMQELVAKMSGQEQDWQKMLDKLLVEMDSKLGRLELDPVKQLLEDRWKSLRQQLKERSPLYQADEAAAMRRQLLAHFHCLSCDRPLETPVTGQVIPVTPVGPGLPGHRSIRPYTVFELEQVRQQSRSLKLGSAFPPRGGLAQMERSVGRLRSMHSKMLMDIEKVQIHFGGSVKASSQMIRELLQAQCLSSPCYSKRAPDIDYTYSTVARRCGGSHTLTYPYRRSRLQHLSQGLYPTEEIQIAMKHDEVDILGLDGHIYKGRMNTRLPGILTKDTAGTTKHKSRQSRPHGHRDPCLGDNGQLPSRPQSAQMSASNNSVPSRQQKDRPVTSEGCLSQPNLAHPPSPTEMANAQGNPVGLEMHMDVPPGEGLEEEPTRGPRSTTAH
ncbi:glutamine-rich protein 2 [Cynocephalus volans]|uniref:glutamine-rich protein 2 n=1 Tax=Cynocephalus volans TaxID=110931 RepID=UPI002FCBDB38